MRQIVKRNDALAYMGESLAPAICGHQDVKESILLLLAGGVEKTLENKTHLRGDVNMLMVRAPECAGAHRCGDRPRLSPHMHAMHLYCRARPPPRTSACAICRVADAGDSGDAESLFHFALLRAYAPTPVQCHACIAGR